VVIETLQQPIPLTLSKILDKNRELKRGGASLIIFFPLSIKGEGLRGEVDR